jgi:glycosyltransferase involved in cell wall biosynthesis
MKIGVWLDTDYNPEEGGGFSYYDRLVKTIDTYNFDKEFEIYFVTDGKSDDSFQRPIITLHYDFYEPHKFLKKSILRKMPLIKYFYKSLWNKFISSEYQRSIKERDKAYHKQLKDSEIKVIYYLQQACYSILPEFPFIATNWDIGHCSTFSFPELTSNSEFENRDYLYSKILPLALMIFTESEAGKKELLQFTNLNESKIKVVPIFAGNCISVNVSVSIQKIILNKYNIFNNKFFFYPAQFWAHKNHNGLLHAFSLFINENPDYKLVLTGFDQGNLNYIKSICRKLGLDNQVLFLGFVSNEEIYSLYKNATSLVMASYFGPTNMPPIEAMELGCPVICSDITGHHEILGDAAIYFQANNFESIYLAMINIIKCRDSFKEKLEKRKRTSAFTIDNALKNINIYLKEVVAIRSNWE